MSANTDTPEYITGHVREQVRQAWYCHSWVMHHLRKKNGRADWARGQRNRHLDNARAHFLAGDKVSLRGLRHTT